ncbi:MAG: STAS-like domain-containing protein [bacterium]
MTGVRSRGQNIRHFILKNVEKHPNDISSKTAERFSISRQAVNKHIKSLVDENALTLTGKTRNRSYRLSPISEWSKQYEITAEIEEDVVWRADILPALGKMPDNVIDIWHYGFTEMFNNCIDHSGGSGIFVWIKKTAVNTEIGVLDDGVGIFKKIQAELNLLDERHAILELAKGKLTTDPSRHTGEGIFFTSRMFDDFDILSGGTHFSHKFGDAEDWILERNKFLSETYVWMKLGNHTARTTKKIFDKYSSGDEYGFNKTVVPVKLAQYGNDKLISRSQAKRLLARVELFQIVIFDFTGVDMIGQAFSDEIFRVFAQQHPEIQFIPTKANSAVKRMIERTKKWEGEG